MNIRLDTENEENRTLNFTLKFTDKTSFKNVFFILVRSNLNQNEMMTNFVSRILNYF